MTKSIHTFLDEHGRIASWPSDRRSAHQHAILEHLRGLFEAGYQYTPEQTQSLLAGACSLPDLEQVLHTLLDAEYLATDGQYYWRADARPKELWTK